MSIKPKEMMNSPSLKMPLYTMWTNRREAGECPAEYLYRKYKGEGNRYAISNLLILLV